MDVAFYTFTKRKNSTKQPTGTGTVKACKLKDNCSIHNPVVICASNTMSYNYAHISTWSRYYFVTDVVYLANNLVEYHLTEDVLASHKIAIGSTKAMIAYASNHYNLQMADSRIPAFAYKTAAGATGVDAHNNDVIFDAGSNSYILTVYNTLDSITSGFSTSYLLGDAQLAVIRHWLAGGSVMDDIALFFNGSPMDAIFSCKWVPYKVFNTDVSADTVVWIGDQFSDPMPSGTYAYRIKGFPYYQNTFSLKRPYIHSDYRAWEPYTRGFVYLPGVGNCEINLGDWKGSAKINLSVNIEVITGNVTYLLFRDDGALMQSFTCNVASDVPMGKMTGEGGKLLTSMGATVGGIAAMAAGGTVGPAGLALSGAAGAFVGTLNTALNANRHVPSIGGTMGGRSVKLWPHFTFTEITAETEDPDDANWIAEKGRPVGYVQTISTFSGYVQTIDAHVALNASDQEMDEVNRLLDSGIYYE